LLLPYQRLAIVVGNATVCLGAASRFLGQLATVQDAFDEAERHFIHALELDARINATPWLARSRYHYARMLQRRGHDGDGQRADQLLREAHADASQLGMLELTRRIAAASGDC
jgi:hypothetical protein